MAQGVAGTGGIRCTVCGAPPARDPSQSSGRHSRCSRCKNRKRDQAAIARNIPNAAALFTADKPQSPLPPIDQLVKQREETGERTIRAYRSERFLNIDVHVDGPIGIWIAGDPHIDDDGCDFKLLRAHSELAVATEGMFAASVGDLQNAWVGRLARLYGNQSTSAREAWALVEWWLGLLGDKLLMISAGNHDCFARNVNGLDPVNWVIEQKETVYQTNGARVGLTTPSGEVFTINCRHDFSGRSQFNPAHGPTRAALFGYKDDLLVAGHTHSFGYNVIKDCATGKVCHCVRLGSYKTVDDYAIERGFPDANVSECIVAILDPFEPDPRHRVLVDANPFRAAKTLTMMRREWRRSQGKKRAA